MLFTRTCEHNHLVVMNVPRPKINSQIPENVLNQSPGYICCFSLFEINYTNLWFPHFEAFEASINHETTKPLFDVFTFEK